MNFRSGKTIAVSTLLSLVLVGPASAAAVVTGIRLTPHNLSKTYYGTGTDTRNVKATTETEVCVFCHTPHAANASAKAPLWNRNGDVAKTYIPYTSSSMDAVPTSAMDPLNGTTSGSSLMCLSCHDGMIALGNVNVLRGTLNPPAIAGLTSAMPAGDGATTGFTRNLGGAGVAHNDLTNDHPISITYDNKLALKDGELRNLDLNQVYPASSTTPVIGLRSPGVKPLLPLEPTGTGKAGQVQCATCHDPHTEKSKFLRLNRFQTASPGGGEFAQATDIICLACHNKLGTAWSQSAHANSTVADEIYTSAAATQRGFPSGTAVWQAACLNCHDTHTVTGARRLLREGTDDANTPKRGGNSAIEETCYQCHNTSTKGVLTANYTSAINTETANVVPDIATEFSRTVHMPITTTQQGGGTATVEVHDITDANFTESQDNLGLNDVKNRHAECTDCHNPHRVIRNELFNGSGTLGQRTHKAGGTAANLGADGNIASGVLRGIWGVEPAYAIAADNTAPTVPTVAPWPTIPTFAEKKGNPGDLTLRSSGYLTREYQLCLKCHSNYANKAGSFPALGASGGTPNLTNGMTNYTNVAAEFGAYATDALDGTDQGEATAGVNGAPGGMEPNHRSWHPVMFPTGRTPAMRGGAGTFANIRAPFNNASNIGKQTMHCSDCHGNSGGVAAATTSTANSWKLDSGPDLTRTQGPHGSNSNFLLKGAWVLSGTASFQTPNSPGVCGNCHNPSGSGGSKSGFCCGNGGKASHAVSEKSGRACNTCHIALPHGWKNKAFLVNLNCVGPETGLAGPYTTRASVSPTNNAFGDRGTCLTTPPGNSWYNAQPYYRNALLKIKTWRSSGNWNDGNCGPMSGTAGKDWMTGTIGNCAAPP